MAENATIQRTAQVSLIEALAALDRIEPVEPVGTDLNIGVHSTLAEDARADTTLRLAGSRLRRVDIALLASQDIERIKVRSPRALVLYATSTSRIKAIAALIARAIEDEGGLAITLQLTDSRAPQAAHEGAEVAQPPEDITLESACNSAEDLKLDLIIAIAEGNGRDEEAVRTLARIGRLEFDRVGLAPGGAIAFGYAGSLPVMLLPGEMPEVLAAWLVFGRRLLARLSFRLIEEQPFLLELARPIASTRGFAEIVPVRRRAAQVEPLTNEGWTAQTIARSDGWILVPAESEGHPAGTKVAMRPWP